MKTSAIWPVVLYVLVAGVCIAGIVVTRRDGALTHTEEIEFGIVEIEGPVERRSGRVRRWERMLEGRNAIDARAFSDTAISKDHLSRFRAMTDAELAAEYDRLSTNETGDTITPDGDWTEEQVACLTAILERGE